MYYIYIYLDIEINIDIYIYIYSEYDQTRGYIIAIMAKMFKTV